MVFLSRVSRWSRAALHYAIVIGASTLVVSNAVVAFTEPALPPPQGTTVAPLNAGTVTQDKSGSLRLQGLRVFSVALLATDSGSVGIGTLSAPSKLTVGPMDTGNEGAEIRFLGAGGNRYFYLDNFTGTLRFISQDASGESVKFVIGNDGNVGIGETAPGSRLSVSGAATIGASYDTTAAPSNGLLVEGNVGIGTTSPASFLSVSSARNGNSAYFAGNVGIGIANPVHGLKLHVEGAVGVRNEMYVAGKTFTLGGLIIEVRSGNPASPEDGRMWLDTSVPVP